MSEPANKIPMVCGRSIAGDPEYFPQAEFHGHKVYFCTEFCLHAFLADPERFHAVHSKAQHKYVPCELLKTNDP